MVKVLVLYYSAYGHIETMAHAVAQGAQEAGAQVDVKRVPDLVPEEVARRALRNGHRGSGLRPHGSVDARGDHWRLPVRGHDDRRRRWIPAADEQ